VKLDFSDSLCVQAAEGWLELGNHLEANEELERITPEMRAHPDVLELRLEIYFRGKLWAHCVEVGNILVKARPRNSVVWIYRSFALHELKQTQEAFDGLLPAAKRFRDVWTIPYNLACYCAQLNRLEDAKEWFKQAMAIDGATVQREAMDDPDLQPLWDSMSGTLWKRE
jgi:tetratricopeptide (TPR) repeat protein